MKVIKLTAIIGKQKEEDISEVEFDIITMDLIRFLEDRGFNLTSEMVLEDEKDNLPE